MLRLLIITVMEIAFSWCFVEMTRRISYTGFTDADKILRLLFLYVLYIAMLVGVAEIFSVALRSAGL